MGMAFLTRRRLAWTAVLGILFGVWWMLGHWGGAGTTLWVVDAITVAAPALATWAFTIRSQAEVGRMAVAWQLMALGAAAWTFGEALWAVDELVLQRGVPVEERSVPFPSLSDAGYVLFLLLATMALAALPGHLWAESARLRIGLDGLL